VLVLNEMVLVIVIESVLSVEHLYENPVNSTRLVGNDEASSLRVLHHRLEAYATWKHRLEA
jgi:hypothetical protein